MIDGFKKFLLRGNVVDLAVAVVIGAAFSTVIKGLVDGFINPLIAAIFGEPDLTGVGKFEINNAVFSIGLILDAVLSFVLVAAAIYFVIVLPLNRLNERRQRGQEPSPRSYQKTSPCCARSATCSPASVAEAGSTPLRTSATAELSLACKRFRLGGGSQAARFRLYGTVPVLLDGAQVSADGLGVGAQTVRPARSSETLGRPFHQAGLAT